MPHQSVKWRTFEEVAQYLLDEFALEFGLERVEGKQRVKGASGTSWEIDAKGVNIDGHGIVLVECRRFVRSRLKQEHVAALAYRIIDAGATGGITVSPLPLQKGAALLANHANIVHVILNPDSTTTEYVMKFLSRIFVGMRASLGFKGDLQMDVIRAGRVIDKRNADS